MRSHVHVNGNPLSFRVKPGNDHGRKQFLSWHAERFRKSAARNGCMDEPEDSENDLKRVEEEEEAEGEDGTAASTAERQAQPVDEDEEPVLE